MCGSYGGKIKKMVVLNTIFHGILLTSLSYDMNTNNTFTANFSVDYYDGEKPTLSEIREYKLNKLLNG